MDNNYFKMISKDLKKLWGGLGLPQKFAILVLIVITGVAMSYFLAKSTEPDWEVLYSDLTTTDVSAIVESLKKSGHPYKISEDKTAVLVPSKDKDDLRLEIAEAGIIQDSTPGFELLDQLQLGATDFKNKLTKQRIFQGELTRTIEKVSGVKKARIQLADPERSVFSDSDEKPSASVMLILEPGYKLKADQVKAIKNIVAYGVAGLTPEKVFVTDQKGNNLSDDMSKNSSDIESFRTNFEKDTSDKIKKVLEKIVGANNVTVEVSSDINFDSARATIEKYTPASENNVGVVTSSQTESESYDNSAPTGGDANIVIDKKKLNYSKTKTSNNYNVSKEVRQVVYAPGSVKRMTIAVAVNKILTAKEKEELKNLVISASGADTTRGDFITVSSIQFESLAEDEAAAKKMEEQSQKEDQMNFIVTKVAPLAVVLILGLAALFVLNSLIKRPVEGQEVYEDNNYLEIEETEAPPELLEVENLPAIEAKLDPELERMKTEINDIILADPAEASRLLLSYIKD